MEARKIRVCVFCGSRDGARPEYREAAMEVGRALAGRGVGLVYGGGRIGLMGRMADAALEAGGEVIGMIPGTLVERELAHTGLTRLDVVETMHQRKALMAELCDAFMVLPGGIGTLEEVTEVLSWASLGLHRKPCGLLNIDGYYDALATLLDHAVAEGFYRTEHRELLLVRNQIGPLIETVLGHIP